MDGRPFKIFNTNEPDATHSVMRVLLLILFLFGALSVGVELLLLGHIESFWQWVPLLLIGISFLALIFHTVAQGAASVRVFQVVMLLFLLSGFIGIGQHYQAKIAFKLEVNPSLSGLELFRETITGATVPPVLAPGMMLQLGLLGLAFTFRHPAFVNSTKRNESTQNGE